MRLGYLDLLAKHGRTAEATIRDSILLAIAAEEAGFSRFWLAEHHSPEIAISSPELLAAAIGQRTCKIRIGIGCVLSQYQTAYKLANLMFGLGKLASGRMDFGIGRGNAGPMHDAYSPYPRNQETPPTFNLRIKAAELLKHLGRLKTEDVSALDGSSAPSLRSESELWMMGSGSESMAIADELALNYAHALFFRASSEGYTKLWQETSWARPLKALAIARAGSGNLGTAIAVAGVCCKTQEEASETALHNPNPYIVPLVVGCPAKCAEQLRNIASVFNTEEVVFHDISRSFTSQLDSIKLLSNEFELDKK
jgi:alkanesulfonate monooxygenase SsuD/methylene tetrahydromethanopterin reductase-like flavin-dependent oxidoreductase (luciferase family)